MPRPKIIVDRAYNGGVTDFLIFTGVLAFLELQHGRCGGNSGRLLHPHLVHLPETLPAKITVFDEAPSRNTDSTPIYPLRRNADRVGLCNGYRRPALSNASRAHAAAGHRYRRCIHANQSPGQALFESRFAWRTIRNLFWLHALPRCLYHDIVRAKLLREMGDDGPELQVHFVTVDPERDAFAELKIYLESFDPRIVGLTGNEAYIDKLMTDFKAYRKKLPLRDGDHTMDHTASVYLFSGDGLLWGTLDRHESAGIQAREDVTSDQGERRKKVEEFHDDMRTGRRVLFA